IHGAGAREARRSSRELDLSLDRTGQRGRRKEASREGPDVAAVDLEGRLDRRLPRSAHAHAGLDIAQPQISRLEPRGALEAELGSAHSRYGRVEAFDAQV